MKKIFNIVISGLLMGAALLSTGCKGGDETSSSSSTQDSSIQTETEGLENGYYILGDFENYQECIQFGQSGYFGKVIQSTDYVTHGAQSARLEVHGYSYQWGYVNPSLTLSTINDYFEKRDFSDCDMFAFDMYSLMDYDLTVKFQIVATDNSKVVQILTIKPGWNYIEMTRQDFGFRWKDEISMFTFIFEKGNLHEETQTVYIDNFRARKIVE